MANEEAQAVAVKLEEMAVEACRLLPFFRTEEYVSNPPPEDKEALEGAVEILSDASTTNTGDGLMTIDLSKFLYFSTMIYVYAVDLARLSVLKEDHQLTADDINNFANDKREVLALLEEMKAFKGPGSKAEN